MKKEDGIFLVSRCCAGGHCRYRHYGYFLRKIKALAEFNDFIALCPEQLGGLPTPREGCSIINGRVIGRRTGRDFTAEYERGAKITLKACQSLGIKKAFLLKNSPSCGKDYGVTALLLEKHGIDVVKI